MRSGIELRKILTRIKMNLNLNKKRKPFLRPSYRFVLHELHHRSFGSQERYEWKFHWDEWVSCAFALCYVSSPVGPFVVSVPVPDFQAAAGIVFFSLREERSFPKTILGGVFPLPLFLWKRCIGHPDAFSPPPTFYHPKRKINFFRNWE